MNLNPGDRVIVFLPRYVDDRHNYVYEERLCQGIVICRSKEEGHDAYDIDVGEGKVEMFHIDWLYPIGDNVTEDQIEAFKKIVTSRLGE